MFPFIKIFLVLEAVFFFLLVLTVVVTVVVIRVIISIRAVSSVCIVLVKDVITSLAGPVEVCDLIKWCHSYSIRLRFVVHTLRLTLSRARFPSRRVQRA